MKHLVVIFIFIVSFLFFYWGASAQTPAASPTTTLEQQINDLKDRIASKVATLKLVEKRGIIGTTIDVTNTQITLSDLGDKTRFVDVDELTKFASSSAKEFGISDISKGVTLGTLGLYNKDSKRLLARFVETIVLPKTFHGVVVEKDSEDFTITLATVKTEIAIDIETTTKTRAYTKEGGLTASGFSKIKVGDRVFVAGFEDKQDKNRIIGERIILFGELPKNPRIQTPLPLTTPPSQNTATPSSE